MKAVVLEVPALHLGYLGCYGNEWVATPALDRLAAEGVVFDQHISDCLGAYPSLRTGRRPMPAPDADDPAHDSGTDLQAALENQGVSFKHVGAAPATEPGAALGHCLQAITAALDPLNSVRRWVLWAEMPSLHPPWLLPPDVLTHSFGTEETADGEESAEPVRPLPSPPLGLVHRQDFALWERVQLTYAAVVRDLDAGLAAAFELLHRAGLLDEVLLAVTTQQGLPLGEHGLLGAGRPWLHEELIHLPLILRLPRATEQGRRVSALTQPVDLFPTLLDACGLTPPEHQGHSLLPLARGEAEQVRAYACAGWRAGGALEWAVRTPEWAFLLPLEAAPGDPFRGPQLFVKPDDRWEVNDIRLHHLELGEALEGLLRDFASATRRPGPLQAPPLPDLKAQAGLTTPPEGG
jgi:hypothetical protein